MVEDEEMDSTPKFDFTGFKAASSILHVLPTIGEQNEVADTLAEAGSESFDEVIIIGFKRGKVYYKSSKTRNVMNRIAALEYAKLQCFAEWK